MTDFNPGNMVLEIEFEIIAFPEEEEAFIEEQKEPQSSAIT